MLLIGDSAGNYRSNNLQKHNEKMIVRFGERQPRPDSMERLPMFVKKIFASQLMSTKWFTKKVLTDKWFLQSHQTNLPAIKE